MKSIEERADRAIYEPTDRHPLKACEVVAFARGYELGATEQKAIDEAQINHDDEANYKQGYHDAAEKACKLIDNYIADLAYPVGWADVKLLISIPERLRKAMEEKYDYVK